MRLLAELLALEADDGILSGVEKLADTAKKAHDRAKGEHKKKEADLKQAARAAEQAKKEAKKHDEDAKKYAQQEAEKAAKEAETEHKLKSAESMQSLKDDLEDYIEKFFSSFPLKDDDDVQAIMEKYPTLEAAKEAFNSFMGIGKRLKELRDGFNKSIIKAKKMRGEAVNRIDRTAKMHVGAGAKSLPTDVIRFVKGESKFFKRLVQVTDDFKLDDAQFKELMGLKINQTDPVNVPKAAEYLNILFLYAAEQFERHAGIIRVAGKNLHDAGQAAEREARNRARAAKAAAAPPTP